jgi:hypothetical protein
MAEKQSPNRPVETFYTTERDGDPRASRVNVLVTWPNDKLKAGRYWDIDRQCTREQWNSLFDMIKERKVFCNIWDNRENGSSGGFASKRREGTTPFDGFEDDE